MDQAPCCPSHTKEPQHSAHPGSYCFSKCLYFTLQLLFSLYNYCKKHFTYSLQWWSVILKVGVFSFLSGVFSG